MRSFHRIMAGFAAAAALSGCGLGSPLHRPVSTARIIDEIKAGEVRWNADWRSQDPSRIVSHYAPDAVVMDAGAAPQVGQAAIRASIDQATSQAGFALTFSSDRVEVARSGELAVARGSYRQTSPDPKTGAAVTETGSYVTVYKPGPDGVWKAVWDINTPGAPAAPAASAP